MLPKKLISDLLEFYSDEIELFRIHDKLARCLFIRIRIGLPALFPAPGLAPPPDERPQIRLATQMFREEFLKGTFNK
jgi:hypothetical protein